MPAFLLGHDPAARIICASYAQELAEKHAQDCRSILSSAWYRRAFPGTRISGQKNTAAEFATTARGFRLATSVGGALTGRGGNFIIVDDPLKSQDMFSDIKREEVNSWFDQTVFSRLDDKSANVIVVIMQRLHIDDLVGHLLRKGNDWVHLNLPAISTEPERFTLADGRVLQRAAGTPLDSVREPVAVLETIKATLGSYPFAAQYLQDPMPLDGGLIKWSWFRTYPSPIQQQAGDLLIHSWDTASKAREVHDYSVCTVWLWRHNVSYLLAVHRDRMEYPLLKKRMVELAEFDHPQAVLIEDTASGAHLFQELSIEHRLPLIAITPTESKVIRALAESARIEGGQVLIPEQAPWLDEFKREVLAFPHGRYADQVDSLSQYLMWIATRRFVDAPFIMIESKFARTASGVFHSGGPAPWDLNPSGSF